MELIPNAKVIALQAVPFLVAISALYFIIFKPMLEYLQGREDAIDGSRKRAGELQEQLTARASEYDARLEAARTEVAELRAARRADSMAAYDARVKEAREAAASKVTAAVAEVHKEEAVARDALRQTADLLAGHIAGQVLGRPVSSGSEGEAHA